MSSLTMSVRAIGKRKPLLPDWHFPWPPGDTGEGLTLRQLITRIVLKEVEAFQARQRDRRFVRILTERRIEEGVERGKVDMGGRSLHQSVDPEDAVGAALQAFEDGIYLVILDGVEQRELDRQVQVEPGSELVFLRLTMLAGA